MSNFLLKLNTKFQGLKNGQEGQDLVEYALLISLIALICISAINGFGTTVNSLFVAVGSSMA
jgi:Flp pilus assembly pilin Flp